MKTAIRSSLLQAHSAVSRRAPEDAIVLSCDPRSGSTWLSELLVEGLDAATIWEPFHLDYAPEIRASGFGWRECIPADADWPEAERLIRRILAGRLINGWTGSASPMVHFIRRRRLLVKCCRANGLLPYMVRRIAFRHRPIHFLRHPFAIAASQLKMGNFTGEGLRAALLDGRYAELFSEHVDYTLGLQSDEERIVAMWCRTHLPCLNDPEAGRLWIDIAYERLVTDPEREMDALFAAWGLPMPEGILARVRAPSRMTQRGSLKRDPHAQITKWTTTFTDSQQRAMLEVLRRFGVAVYGSDPFPAASPAAQLHAQASR